MYMKRRYRIIRLLTIASLFLQHISIHAQKTSVFADSIRKLYRIPEMSYAVVNSHTTLEIAALGKHAIHLPDTATLNDRYHIGSNTKAMTAFMIARYVEKGYLTWNTPFFTVFPEWKNKSNPAYLHITLQDLLTHKAGIQAFQGEDDPVIPDFKGTKQQKRKEFGKFVLTLDPVKPDEQNPFIYSNAGYTLATLMVEKLTGKSWEQLIDQVFNKELHLQVQFSWPENQKRKDTWGHKTENDQLKPVPSSMGDQLDYTEPAGDLNITLKDYIRFIQLNLKGLKGENNYLKASTYNRIHNGTANYALGWFNIFENGKQLSVHAGTGAFTYFTLVHIDKQKDTAYIIFTNAYNPDTQQGVRILMRKLKEHHGY